MGNSKKQSKIRERITEKQVIDRIMSVIEFLPDIVKDLPANKKERSYWTKLFKNGEPAKHMLEVLREMPAFTYRAPKKPSRAAWLKVFEKHMGPFQFPQMLKRVSATAGFTPVKRKKIKYWRDAFGSGELVQRVRPEESMEYIPNPHRGTTTFQRFQGEEVYPTFITSDTDGPVTFPAKGKIKENPNYIPRTTLTYCRWPWSWFEPQKGKYNWSLIDNSLKAARQAGQTAQMRFQPYSTIDSAPVSPEENYLPKKPFVNVPRWFWKTGAKVADKMIYTANEPNINDPLYIKHFGDFVRAFAKRYDGHPDLESIDVAFGGFWGEGGGNATRKTAQKIAKIYVKSFKKTQLLFMLANLEHFSKLLKKSKNAPGFRSDCIGDLSTSNSPDVPAKLGWNHTFDSYPKEIWGSGFKDAWQKAPVTMETCGNVATWVAEGYDFDIIRREGYRYHTSIFMPKNVFYPESVMEKMKEFDRIIGYRYALRQVLLPLEIKGGSRLSAEFFIDNVGVAPIYRPYKLALRLSQGKKVKIVKFKEDIRTWLPGHKWFKDSIVFPKGFKKGEVKLALGIVNDKDTPKVWFAITEKTDKGWHPLTSVDAL